MVDYEPKTGIKNMNKKYKVNQGKQFLFRYYNSHMESETSCAISGEVVEVTPNGIDILSETLRIPTINMPDSINRGLQAGILSEVE